MRAIQFLKVPVVAILLFAFGLAPSITPPLEAQPQSAPASNSVPIPTSDELDQLLAPVALYPDSLLAQITTASTNPQEILDVDNWLQANPNLSGSALTDAAQQQQFDPAFIALVNFPQIITMMAENIDDYAAIGEAFNADQTMVSTSIQRLRAEAYAAGSLRSNDQQQVEIQKPAPGQTIYVIQPAAPQVVYVPEYDPAAVYIAAQPSSPVIAPLITFGAGIAIGALLVDNQPWGWGGWGWNWGMHRAYYNRGVWAGWGNPYRPPHYWYRPRPIRWTSRPGYRGDWHYRPPNYRPPSYGRPPNHRPWGPGNRPTGYRPQPRPGNGNPGRPGNGNPGRPGTGNPGRPGNGNPGKPGNGGRPNPGQPGNRPPTKPGTPTNGRPNTGRPNTGNPGTRPGNPSTGQPGNPGTRPTNPGTRPTPTPKPGNPSIQPVKPQPRPSNPGGNQPRPQPSQPKPAPTRQPQSRPAPQAKPAPRSNPN